MAAGGGMSGRARILVVGAGPTGLSLALQATALGAEVRLIERRELAFRPSRALILHPRTLEVLRPLGVTGALLARADTAPAAQLHLGERVIETRLAELALADTAFPHLSFIRQMDVESVLEEALGRRGVAVERGTEFVRVEDSHGDARAVLRRGGEYEEYRCDFVAGCDGPESTVRSGAGIGWRGGTYLQEVVLADLELDGELAPGVAHVVVGRQGLVFLFALGEQASWRLLATRRAAGAPLPFGRPGPPVPLPELQELLAEAGLPGRVSELVWSARYPVQHRLADRFRAGRRLLAGDAAHAYSPATGNGMNTGIQDAVNLGWKLAFAPAASDPERLLDSYELERRPVARRVLAMTHLAFWGEAATSPLPALMRGVLAPLAGPAVRLLMRRRRLIASILRQVAQLGLAYSDSPLSAEGRPKLSGGPPAGDRLPDARVEVGAAVVQLHALLAKPGVHVLLQRDAGPVEDLALGPSVAVHRLDNVPGPGVMIVRPDGYVGFRCGVADSAQLHAYLARIGAIQEADASRIAVTQPAEVIVPSD